MLTARFQRAFTVACEVHAAQLRKGTRIPYLAHLMSVAALVLEHGGGEDAAIGGLLHDAVEDSSDGTQTEQRIREELGDHVAGIVMGCSDAVAVPGQPKPPWRDRKAAYIDHLAGEDDPDVLPARRSPPKLPARYSTPSPGPHSRPAKLRNFTNSHGRVIRGLPSEVN